MDEKPRDPDRGYPQDLLFAQVMTGGIFLVLLLVSWILSVLYPDSGMSATTIIDELGKAVIKQHICHGLC
jgi:hypothetical protein